MKFRVKSEVIEAIQFQLDALHEACRFMGIQNSLVYCERSEDGINRRFNFKTPSGDLVAKSGDWIIKDGRGNFCVLPATSFSAMYEPAD